MKNLFIILLISLHVTIFSQNFNYDVTHYTLNLKVDPSEYYIQGNVDISFKTIQSTDDIAINMNSSLNVDSIFCNDYLILYSHTKNILTIIFDKTLSENKTATIRIYYHGIPNSSSFGSFNTSSHNGTPIMYTLSEPYGAEDWWPCKNTLDDKADSIDIFITAPKQYKVASSGLRISETLVGDNLKITHWKHLYPISAYLVCFSVTNYAEYFEYANIGDSVQIPIMEMVYPEDSAYLSETTPMVVPIIEFFSDKFGIYPFYKEKYGHAQFPWGGGMEHQSMTFLGVFTHELIAHELAHQWFGDCITCASWKEIWLNEGFAVFAEGLTAEAGLAPYSWQEWKDNTINDALESSSGSVYVEDTSSAYRIFNHRLTYMKGAYIIQMLRKVVGDSVFFEGVRNYLSDTALAYGYAHVDDFKKHIEDVADTNLTEFFNDWYYGAGYPKYKMNWEQKENYLIIMVSQKDMSGNNNFFEMPITFKVEYPDRDSLIRVQNDKNNQIFVIKINGNVRELIFDPDRDILTKNSVMVHKISKKDDIVEISPNPTDSNLIITFKTATFVNILRIFDLKGNLIKYQEIKKQTQLTKIDVSKLSKGTYFIEIETNKNTFSKIFYKK